MPQGHPGLPPKAPVNLSKSALLGELVAIDNDPAARARVLAMETDFKARIQSAIAALPLSNARFDKFRTNPYVLLMRSQMQGYSRISQIEDELLPAKLFSSLETSAGKMIELVTLPVYGWANIPSTMHTAYSALDGKKVSGPVLTVATLKSGPVCLNDEMAENFADAILQYAPIWAADAGVTEIEFTYGVLYGTPAMSNKKDWHILRNLHDKLGDGAFSERPTGRWSTRFLHQGIAINASVRIGSDWWTYLGGNLACQVEIWTALIRACVTIGAPDPMTHPYVIQDLRSIVSGIPVPFNVAILQAGQLPWLFFVARHFADALVP